MLAFVAAATGALAPYLAGITTAVSAAPIFVLAPYAVAVASVGYYFARQPRDGKVHFDAPIKLDQVPVAVCVAAHHVISLNGHPYYAPGVIEILGLSRTQLPSTESDTDTPETHHERAALVTDAWEKIYNKMADGRVPPGGGSTGDYLDAVDMAAGLLSDATAGHIYLTVFELKLENLYRKAANKLKRELKPDEKAKIRLESFTEDCREIWKRLGFAVPVA